MTNINAIKNLRIPTAENPLRILVSACMTGSTCGYDGTSNGTFPSVRHCMNFTTARIFHFCPEEFSFGTPREMSDIYGGTGEDVLQGTARVFSESGKDWTEGMIKASEKMLSLAQKHDIELAILMDISAACGSQVIYNGNRFSEKKVYQIGAGVSAAQLIRNGFTVISQRDYASLDILYAKLDPHHIFTPNVKDHHETDWYREHFKIL